MRRRVSVLWSTLVLVFVLASGAGAGPKWSNEDTPGDKDHHGKHFTRNRGELFCPAAALVYGNIIIPARQCYVLSVLRDDRRTFLAFVPPDAHIPPGQLVRLNTPAGPKLKGRMFLVPIQTAVGAICRDLGRPHAQRRSRSQGGPRPGSGLRRFEPSHERGHAQGHVPCLPTPGKQHLLYFDR